MKKLFLDTEFTDLHPEAKLISIALVDEDGKFFYAELNDTYELKDCSNFVKQHVLPFLKGGEYVMSEKKCALSLANWIEDRNVDCILAMDNPSWDYPFLKRLLEKTWMWPSNLAKMEDKYYKFQVMDEVVHEIVHVNGYNIHNALDDAKVMAAAYRMGEAWEV